MKTTLNPKNNVVLSIVHAASSNSKALCFLILTLFQHKKAMKKMMKLSSRNLAKVDKTEKRVHFNLHSLALPSPFTNGHMQSSFSWFPRCTNEHNSSSASPFTVSHKVNKKKKTTSDLVPKNAARMVHTGGTGWA
jgi:hypothetical protein